MLNYETDARTLDKLFINHHKGHNATLYRQTRMNGQFQWRLVTTQLYYTYIPAVVAKHRKQQKKSEFGHISDSCDLLQKKTLQTQFNVIATHIAQKLFRFVHIVPAHEQSIAIGRKSRIHLSFNDHVKQYCLLLDFILNFCYIVCMYISPHKTFLLVNLLQYTDNP